MWPRLSLTVYSIYYAINVGYWVKLHHHFWCVVFFCSSDTRRSKCSAPGCTTHQASDRFVLNGILEDWFLGITPKAFCPDVMTVVVVVVSTKWGSRISRELWVLQQTPLLWWLPIDFCRLRCIATTVTVACPFLDVVHRWLARSSSAMATLFCFP